MGTSTHQLQPALRRSPPRFAGRSSGRRTCLRQALASEVLRQMCRSGSSRRRRGTKHRRPQPHYSAGCMPTICSASSAGSFTFGKRSAPHQHGPAVAATAAVLIGVVSNSFLGMRTSRLAHRLHNRGERTLLRLQLPHVLPRGEIRSTRRGIQLEVLVVRPVANVNHVDMLAPLRIGEDRILHVLRGTQIATSGSLPVFASATR